MLKAARFGDQISHTQQRSGLITGMIVGALIVGAVVLAVASGGTAIPALIAVGAVLTGAAVGGGIGRLIGGEQTVPKGNINKAATTVFVNSRATPAARSCIDTALCQDHTLQLIATGSTTVYVERFPAARVTDIGACSFAISQGSPNVFIGGATAQCAGVEITPEVEPWLENLHRVVGWVGGLCLLGPAYGLRIALASVVGGEFGSRLGGAIDRRLGGNGVIGSILGGIIGGGIPLNPRVGSVINRLYVRPNVLGMNGGNIGLRPLPPPRPANSPHYSVGYEAQLQRGSHYPGLSDRVHFAESNRQLHNAMRSDPVFARNMEQMYPGITRGVAPGPRGAFPRTAPTRDVTWHHHPTREGAMQLIPRSHHRAGGAVQGSLHPNQRGGMENWGGGR